MLSYHLANSVQGSPLRHEEGQSQEAVTDTGVGLEGGSSCLFVRFAGLCLAGRGHFSAVVVERMQNFVPGAPTWERESCLLPDSRSCLPGALHAPSSGKMVSSPSLP